MNELLLALLGAALALLVVVIFNQLRRRDSQVDLQRQFGELRATIDGVSSSQAERLGETGRVVADVRERLGALVEATRRLERVGESVSQVQELLRVPKLRGMLGEVWLEEMLAQVFPAALYTMQYTFKSGETVDAVLRIGPRLVPIDSKFPLEACNRMLEADGDARNRETRAFHRSLRARIDEIAAKYIRPEEDTFDFALMYVPAENVFYEAVRFGVLDEASPSAYALERKVIIVSPNTFYAYLSAILHGLKGLEVERRARDIQESLGGLHQQFERFERNFALIGKHLVNASRQFDEADRQIAGIMGRFDSITRIGEQEERNAAELES